MCSLPCCTVSETDSAAARLEPSSIPAVKASTWCVLDAATGQLLGGSKPNQRRPVASTQKLLTAIIVVETGDLGKLVTIVESDTDVTGSTLGLKAGDIISRADLLQALLLESANDAAVALARDTLGSVEAFARRMNVRARACGAARSRFVNSHGLTTYRQRSTAKDMAKIAREALLLPHLRGVVSASTAVIHINGRPRIIHNANELLQRLPGCTGMKTGITPGAGICLISSYRGQGREVIAVQLDSDKEHIYTDAARLMKWGAMQR
jgi:serine-type D-Ala-D-Ala carboxypeptidase (penicillin-binding protein 5/6)